MKTLQFGRANNRELPDILNALDNEFVYSRMRTLPMRKRFPGLFSNAPGCNCFVLRDSANRWCSFAASEERELGRPPHNICRVFTIGSVFTPAEYRGRGYAATLLQNIAAFYQSQAFAGGYLWTGINQFYEKLGWQTRDKSIVMIVRTPVPATGGRCVIMTRDTAQELARKHLGALRRRADGSDYFKIIPPGDCGICLTSEVAGGGYLCGAYNKKTGYVYELHGSPEVLRELLKDFQTKSGADELWINLISGQPEHDALSHVLKNVEIRTFNLQMSLIFSKNEAIDLEELTISFLDRI